MPKVSEHEEVETVTIPKVDFDKMVSIINQARVLLLVANEGFLKIDEGVQRNARATENDKSNTVGGNAGTTAPAS